MNSGVLNFFTWVNQAFINEFGPEGRNLEVDIRFVDIDERLLSRPFMEDGKEGHKVCWSLHTVRRIPASGPAMIFRDFLAGRDADWELPAEDFGGIILIALREYEQLDAEVTRMILFRNACRAMKEGTLAVEIIDIPPGRQESLIREIAYYHR